VQSNLPKDRIADHFCKVEPQLQCGEEGGLSWSDRGSDWSTCPKNFVKNSPANSSSLQTHKRGWKQSKTARKR